MTSELRATVVVPTFKRAASLSVCLEALAALTTDPTTFEILVVDNNSPDNTRDVCLEFAQTHPAVRVRHVCEKQQGASHARNRGVLEASGQIVCFLDDDSPPTATWLDCLLGAFADPLVGCAGGPSMLDFQDRDVPSWLRGDLQGLLSGYALPYGAPTAVSRWDQLPLSCNMAIRRDLFFELGFFRTDLDRSGHQVLAAGDTEMAHRIGRAGWKVLYVPDATVRHLVPPERLNKKHIYRIGRGLAESHVILTSDARPRAVARWFASDSWYATRMFSRFVASVVRRSPLWFDDYMRFWMVAQRIPVRARSLWQNRAAPPRQGPSGTSGGWSY